MKRFNLSLVLILLLALSACHKKRVNRRDVNVVENGSTVEKPLAKDNADGDVNDDANDEGEDNTGIVWGDLADEDELQKVDSLKLTVLDDIDLVEIGIGNDFIVADGKLYKDVEQAYKEIIGEIRGGSGLGYCEFSLKDELKMMAKDSEMISEKLETDGSLLNVKFSSAVSSIECYASRTVSPEGQALPFKGSELKEILKDLFSVTIVKKEPAAPTPVEDVADVRLTLDRYIGESLDTDGEKVDSLSGKMIDTEGKEMEIVVALSCKDKGEMTIILPKAEDATEDEEAKILDQYTMDAKYMNDENFNALCLRIGDALVVSEEIQESVNSKILIEIKKEEFTKVMLQMQTTMTKDLMDQEITEEQE